MTDISITIVAYNDEEDVKNAVCSIMEHTAVTIQKKIYIVDNSTEKNSLELFAEQQKEVFYRKPKENLGFGGGHNYVLSELGSKYHAIVNPDIILKEDSLKILIEFMEQGEMGMAVPRMTDEQGKLQSAYRRELTVFDMGIRMFLSPCFKKRQAYHTMQDMDYSKPFPVPFAQGSFLVIRTELFQKLGGFDTRYFMYVEDADICKQVNQCSSLYYCPNTTVIHKWERASKKNGKLRRVHMASMFRYFRKWGWKLW